MKFIISFLFCLMVNFIFCLPMEEETTNKNKYYIITIKDSSKYSYNIEFGNREEKLQKRDQDENQNFVNIHYDDVKDIIKSHDCLSKVEDMNLNDTTLCDLQKDKSIIKKDKLNINELEKKLEPKESFVKSQLDLLAELIMENIDTYDEDDSIIEEIQNLKQKRSTTSLDELADNKAFSKILRRGFNLLDVSFIYAYLSEELYNIIKDLPDVVSCTENIKLKIPEEDMNMSFPEAQNKTHHKRNINMKKRENENNYYNLTDIRIDTQWTDVNVQKNAFDNLSVISQGKIKYELIEQYDENFYYPSSAGEGVDIYIVDDGINAYHTDFDTTNRTVSCDYMSTITGEYEIDPNSEEYKICEGDYDTEYAYDCHGTHVASAAAGTEYGVAKNANIHAIATDYHLSSIHMGFNYIMQNAKNPHKTIINCSFGGYYYDPNDEKITNVMAEKGFIIIASAGNDHTDACTEECREIKNEIRCSKHHPGAFDNVIAVGAVRSFNEWLDYDRYKRTYKLADFSNYGSCIDIYSPGYCEIASVPGYFHEDQLYSDYEYARGTSFACPFTAGVAASLIAEHPEITFDVNSMRKMLIDLSLKDIITDFESNDNNNRFLNNGKKTVYSSNNVYHGCGAPSGKRSCPSDKCCSISGYCRNDAEACEINCLSEFGSCSLNQTPPPIDGNTTYTAISYKGKTSKKFYLGVSGIETNSKFTLKENNKYYTWLVTSTSSPSFMYFSNGEEGLIGEFTNLCLNVSDEKESSGYNYVNIVNCSEATYKFMYNDSYSDAINIYTKDDEPFTNAKGEKLCLYYTTNPRIYKCKNPESTPKLAWERELIGEYNHNTTNTTTIITTTTIDTTSTTTATITIDVTNTTTIITTTTDAPKPTYTSTNGECGDKPDGIYICSNNNCCSKFGYCGSTSLHCGTGCQTQFGSCQ